MPNRVLGPPTVDVAGDRTRCQQVAGRIANMTGIALVPDALWREAEPSAVLRLSGRWPPCGRASRRKRASPSGSLTSSVTDR